MARAYLQSVSSSAGQVDKVERICLRVTKTVVASRHGQPSGMREEGLLTLPRKS